MNKNQTILQKFIDFNAKRKLAAKKKRVLLAVSGGVDSVVMCELFKQAGYAFAIAHCNFQLRGEESNGDEKFVQELAAKYGVAFFVAHFDTQEYATEKGISTQEAARELRYNWFEEVRGQNKLNAVATAHHLNDNIETIIFNLIKGTGIRGLRGIPVKQGHIIRPMLNCTREEIEQFAKDNNLQFREDSSNKFDKYTRNKIRHSLIPLMKEINPSLEDTIAEKVDLFMELESLYEKEVDKSVKQLFLKRKNDIYIPILKLKKTANASSTLFEYLKEYGFNKEQVQDLMGSLDAIPGKQFLSSTSRIIKDRRFFILSALNEKRPTTALLDNTTTELELNGSKLKVLTLKNENLKISPAKNIAFLDKAKLEFPLIVRDWKQGDYFYPFGMKLKKKKLKKFLTDEKVPLNEKEEVKVIESNKKIVWVVGYRIDERFKVSANTTEVLKLEIK